MCYSLLSYSTHSSLSIPAARRKAPVNVTKTICLRSLLPDTLLPAWIGFAVVVPTTFVACWIYIRAEAPCDLDIRHARAQGYTFGCRIYLRTLYAHHTTHNKQHYSHDYSFSSHAHDNNVPSFDRSPPTCIGCDVTSLSILDVSNVAGTLCTVAD